jgi:hypothetical protein
VLRALVFSAKWHIVPLSAWGKRDGPSLELEQLIIVSSFPKLKCAGCAVFFVSLANSHRLCMEAFEAAHPAHLVSSS